MPDPAPVILFVYNRPDHTRQTIQALENNDLAASTTLFVFADGPKSTVGEAQMQQINETRAVIKASKGFKKVIISESDINKGLSASVIEGVSQVVEEYGKVIVLEDDIVTGRGFLTYMNEALELYKDAEEIISISGYNFPIAAKGLPETFFLRGADCWGWATWRRGWALFEQDANKLYNELVQRGMTAAFDMDNSYPYTQMLQDHVSGKVNSWAIRWHASAFLARKLSLYPRVSLVKNIGLDGSGTHGRLHHSNDFFTGHCAVKKIAAKENDRARTRIIAHYSSSGHSLSKNNTRLIKKLLKKTLPPVLIDLVRTKNTAAQPAPGMWAGSYSNWQEAQAQTSGYNEKLILDRVFNAVSAVYRGEAVYERDGVIFDKVQHSWPILACLQKIALAKGSLRVLDFGGSLGSSYFQNRAFLQDVQQMQWHVVEQSHFVDCGKKNLEGPGLYFHLSVDDVYREHQIDCLFLSGVLQYLEKPYEWISTFLKKQPEYILIDRNAFIDDNKNRLTVQTVPASIYEASYPCWFFNENDFLSRFEAEYKLMAEFDSYAELPTALEDGRKIYWKGFLLKRK